MSFPFRFFLASSVFKGKDAPFLQIQGTHSHMGNLWSVLGKRVGTKLEWSSCFCCFLQLLSLKYLICQGIIFWSSLPWILLKGTLQVTDMGKTSSCWISVLATDLSKIEFPSTKYHILSIPALLERRLPQRTEGGEPGNPDLWPQSRPHQVHVDFSWWRIAPLLPLHDTIYVRPTPDLQQQSTRKWNFTGRKGIWSQVWFHHFF